MARKKKGFSLKKLTTIKGIIKYSPAGVFQRSKKLRKIGLISGAVVGAFYAAPFIAAGGSSAFGAASKGGAFAFQAAKKLAAKAAANKLSNVSGRGNESRGRTSTAPADEQSSPTEDAFFGISSRQNADPNSPAGRAPYGAAASGAALSSCAGPASAGSSLDGFWNFLDASNITLFTIATVVITATICANYYLVNRIKK